MGEWERVRGWEKVRGWKRVRGCERVRGWKSGRVGECEGETSMYRVEEGD